MPEQWSNFFVMVGGGAAALAGLIFVAMSINPGNTFRDTTHRNRATNMLSGFTAVFMACGFALMGNLTLLGLGAIWLVLWTVALVIFVRGYATALKSGQSSIGLNVPRLAGGTLCYLAEVVGSALLTLGYPEGIGVAAIATVILFGFLISGAWLIMIGAHEEGGPTTDE